MAVKTRGGIPEAWVLELPYGGITYCAFLLSLFGVLLYCLASFKCWLTVSETSDYTIYIGYWKREDYILASIEDRNYCVRWHPRDIENRFDALWRYGRAAAVIGSLLGGLNLLFCIYIIIYVAWPLVFAVFIILNFVMSLFSLSLLLGLLSDVCELEDCKFGPGMYLAVVASVLYLILTCLMCKFRSISLLEPEPLPEEEFYNDGYEEEEMYDYPEDYDDRESEPPRSRRSRPPSSRRDYDDGAIADSAREPRSSRRGPPRSSRSENEGAIVPRSSSRGRPPSSRSEEPPPSSRRSNRGPRSGRESR